MNEMPLNDRDFAEIRGNVMRAIARRNRRNAIFAACSVAFAVLAIVFVLMPRKVENHGGEGAAAPLRTLRTTTAAALPVLHRAAAPPPPVFVATSQPKQPHHRSHHRARKPQPIAIASTEEQLPITIELHTANPDIRIIWIAK